MNAWLALMKKEFQLSLPAFLMAVIFLAGIFGAGYIVGNYTGYRDELLVGVASFVTGIHLFSLVFYLFYSLSIEKKCLHLWLHNPMSIGGLLSTKLLTGIIYTATTFTVSLTLTVIFFRNLTDMFNQQTMVNLIGTITATVLLTGLMIAITFLFFWAIYLTLSQKMNDFISFILTFLLFILVAWGYGHLMDLAFMQALTNWGAITVDDILLDFQFRVDATESMMVGQTFSDSSILYIGEFVIGIIESVILFFAACWVIEKKVEV